MNNLLKSMRYNQHQPKKFSVDFYKITSALNQSMISITCLGILIATVRCRYTRLYEGGSKK